MGGAKRPRKILFPGQYDADLIIAQLKKLPVIDRTVRLDLSTENILPYKTVDYRNKRLKDSGSRPMKMESRDFVYQSLMG